MGEKVNLIHQCSLNPNNVARKTVLSVFQGDIVRFQPLDVIEFGSLVHKVLYNCEDYGVFERQPIL